MSDSCVFCIPEVPAQGLQGFDHLPSLRHRDKSVFRPVEYPYRCAANLTGDSKIGIERGIACTDRRRARNPARGTNTTDDGDESSKYCRMFGGNGPRPVAAYGVPDQIEPMLITMKLLYRLLEGLQNHGLHVQLVPVSCPGTVRKHHHGRQRGVCMV